MYKITDKLGTHGFCGSARVTNLYMNEEDLQTGYLVRSYDENHNRIPDEFWDIVDVRTLKDGEPNDLLDYASHINRANQMIDKKGKVMVCCEAGQSRSNAIALGVLMTFSGGNMLYWDAIELIRKQVPIAMIDPYHLKAIRRIFGVHELH